MLAAPEQLASMRSAAFAIDESFNSLSAIQQNLNMTMNDLMTTWSGPSAGKFYRLYSTIDAELCRILQSLDDVHDHLVAVGSFQ